MPVTNDARRSNTSAKPSLVLGKNPIRLELAGGVVGVPDVPISVAGEVRILVMRRMEFAEALDGGEGWPHQDQIGKELVLPGVGK